MSVFITLVMGKPAADYYIDDKLITLAKLRELLANSLEVE